MDSPLIIVVFNTIPWAGKELGQKLLRFGKYQGYGDLHRRYKGIMPENEEAVA
jgi:hypothetical protein